MFSVFKTKTTQNQHFNQKRRQKSFPKDWITKFKKRILLNKNY